MFRPETAMPLNQLAEVLLTSSHSLERGERELIAAYVSHLNQCVFCHSTHGAAAQYLLSDTPDVIEAVKRDYRSAPISEKMKALLTIAGKVQRDGRLVAPEDIEEAREKGATDIELHDTVLIAAAFCMFNRYVDGLGTWAPDDPAMYAMMGARLAQTGYVGTEKEVMNDK
jgi:uncharacterized peroxidase-related enzyme